MAWMDSDEYLQNRKEADRLRKGVQIHKRDFDNIRREMRENQKRWDKINGSTDAEDYDDQIFDANQDKLIS